MIKKNNTSFTGCKNIYELINFIKNTYPDMSITVNGNGYELHKKLFNSFYLPATPLLEYASLHAVTEIAFNLHTKHETMNQLLPLYLKQYSTQTKSNS